MKNTQALLWILTAATALPIAAQAQLAGLADAFPAKSEARPAALMNETADDAAAKPAPATLPAPTADEAAPAAPVPAAPAKAAEKPAAAAKAAPAVPAAEKPAAAAKAAPAVPAAAAILPRDASSREDEIVLRQEKEANPWRLSVGYEWRSPVKAKFQFVPTHYRAGKPQAFGSSYQTQGAASSAANNGDYDNGYVHPDSGTPIDGDTTAWSANDMSQYSAADETITFSSTYGVGSTSIKQPTAVGGEEEERFSGITFDISRDIWSSGAFSLRAAIGFSHDSRKDMIENTHAFSLGSSSLALYQRQDVYDVKYWAGVPPDTLQNQGGSDEMGAEIPATPASTRDVSLGGGGSAVYNGGASFAMDYRMTEFRFALEPEYAIASWLAIYGQAGVAVGKGKASWDVSSWFSTNGSKKTLSDSDEKEETFVDGFVGLGLRIMPIENLGVSVFGDYRFGTGEIEVDADPYTCKLETGKMRYGAALTLAF